MIVRIARHTNKIEALKIFYTELIGLKILGEFYNHDGYDGVFVGKEDLNWHLEFTTSSDKAKQIIDDDDLLVFYPESERDYENILERIKAKRIKIENAKNPYWNQNGILIKDPDGFSVIISDLKTSNNDL